MRLALLVPGGVDRSGTERVVPALLWLIERLARRHDVHVFALHHEPAPGEWELLGARVHNIGGEGARRRRLFAHLGAEARAAPFDVLHAFWGGPGFYAALAGWRHRVPVVVHLAGGELVALHDVGYGSGLTLRGRLTTRLAAALAPRVTVASAPMQQLAAAHGIRAELVPLGVALDRWPPRPPRPRDSGRPARLLHIGDLRPVKDQATLLAAAARLRADGVAFRLDVAGVDTMGGAVQRMSESLGLGSVTRWHGHLGRDALRVLVDAADVLLVTSRHEAGPLAVLEAAVAGVPTVGTAVGHVAEWAPAAAVAVPVGDAAALARETAALLADEPRRLATAREALRRATARDADWTAARFEHIYEELAGGSRRRPHPARPAPSPVP
jgi:glycosyltransferase involved in cell wall biosynthesis